MKPIGLVLGLVLTTLVSAPALAGHGRYDRDEGAVYARVVDVEPIFRTVRVSTPQRECFEEEVPYRRPYRGDSYTGVIAGGLLGGVLGNGIGRGHGRDIATIGGALLGGSIGRDLTRGGYDGGYEDVQVRERCRVVERFREEQRPAGYQVSYRYHGRIYDTHTDHRPGKRIRVSVPYADDDRDYDRDFDRDYNERGNDYNHRSTGYRNVSDDYDS